MKKRIAVTSILIAFTFTALMYCAAITHAQGPWTLTVVSAHDSPNPAVGVHTYNDNDSVTCSVSSPVLENGITYTCTGYTGTGDVPTSGSDTSVTFTISQDSNITWNWQITQWTLTVTSAHGSPSPSVGDHTYADETLVTCSVSSPVVEGSTVWTCTGWTGTGSVPSSGSDVFVTFTISQDSAITWNWNGAPVQRSLTVVSAHGSPSPGVGDTLYDDGSFVTCSVSSPVVEGSTVWTCTGWTGTGSVLPSGSGVSTSFAITQDSTITWNWNGAPVQRSLTVVSAHDSPSPSVGYHVYDDGTLVTCSVSSPVVEGSTVWTCTGWTGTGSVLPSGSGVSLSFTIGEDSTITWNWNGAPVQRSLTVVSAHDNPSPSVGYHVYDDGTLVTCSVSSLVTEDGVTYACTGWIGTGSVPSSGADTSVTFTISENSTITWVWQIVQRGLTVVSAHGSPNPGVGYHVYDDGTLVTCSVASPVTEGRIVYTCTGWTGTGSVPSSGSDASVTFVISQDSTITWNWEGAVVKRRLTVASDHGSPIPGVGDSLYDDGSSVTCSVASPVTENGVTYECTGWTGTGSVPSTGSNTSVTFIISQRSTITWVWQIVRRSLTVVSAHGSPRPSVGSHTYNYGTSVTCNVSAFVIEGGVTYACIGWVGSGSVPSTGSNTSVTFIILQDSNITWKWQIVEWILTVTSPHGNPNPSVGYHTYNNGSSVTCSVSSPVLEGGVSYICTGWSGTGSVASTGSETSVTFTISQDSTVTWTWKAVQRSLTVASAHDSPTPSVGDHVYDDGSSVTCRVTSPATKNGTTYACIGWVGSGSVPSTGSGTSVTFKISENSTITWNWQIVRRSLTVVSAHGSPTPSVGDHVYDDGSSVTCRVTSPVTDAGQTWTCTGWVGTGSVPASGSGVSVTFSVHQNSSITWNWQARSATIESRDEAGVQKDVFSLDETVYIVGSGFGMNQTYIVYVVHNTAWFDGANIIGQVQLSMAHSDSSGNINLTAVYNKSLASGVYDILVDVNGNGKYDAGVDVLYEDKVIAVARMRDLSILGLAGGFTALGVVYLMYKRRHHSNRAPVETTLN